MNNHNGIIIRPYTHKELAALYKVSWLTLQRWLKPHEEMIGRKIGHFYTARQVETIFKLIGWPESVYQQEEEDKLNAIWFLQTLYVPNKEFCEPMLQ